jgi:dinuclear metal center YbgI/SA1388 family protein
LLVKNIYTFLNKLSPFDLQEKWDNAGLIVGSLDDEIKKVYISIDLDEELLEMCEEKSLIITHHPLIFKGLKRVNYDSYSTKLLQKLIKKDISLISMHTNIDKTHLNKYVVTEVLGLKLENTDDFISYANVNMKFDDLVKSISRKLNLKTTKAVRCNDFIKNVAIVTGSGMSLINEVKADCFLTGDIKYHDAMEAKARGISLIDIRHYESERYFSDLLEGLLSEYLNKNELTAIITASKNPFEFFIEGETIE